MKSSRSVGSNIFIVARNIIKCSIHVENKIIVHFDVKLDKVCYTEVPFYCSFGGTCSRYASISIYFSMLINHIGPRESNLFSAPQKGVTSTVACSDQIKFLPHEFFTS